MPPASHRAHRSGARPGPARAVARYARRRPETTVLYQIVQQHLETFLADAPEHTSTGAGYPKFIEDEFRSYLRCGILSYGFARVVCADCQAEDLVAFSCKGRLCPSCTARRMNETAAQLCDHTLPNAGYRQWTLSVPWRYRLPLAKDGASLSRCLSLMLRAIFAWQRRCARKLGIASPQTGAVSFCQRFGSTINLHPHWHSLVPDGVFAEVAGVWQYVPLPPPTDDEVAALCDKIGRRITDYFDSQWETGACDVNDDDGVPPAAVEQALVVPLPTFSTGSTEGPKQRPRCAWVDGFSLDADVAVDEHDRAGLERLCRYGGRPCFAASRLRKLPSGKIAYKLKKPWWTGQTEIVMTPQDLLRRLAAIMPPRGQNLIRFHGCFAPRAACRDHVLTLVPHPAAQDEPCKHTRDVAMPLGDPDADPPPRPSRQARINWATLMKRTFGHDLLHCPCGGTRNVIACLTDPEPIAAILTHLDLPTKPPPIAPARAPPQLDFFDDAASNFADELSTHSDPPADFLDWAE